MAAAAVAAADAGLPAGASSATCPDADAGAAGAAALGVEADAGLLPPMERPEGPVARLVCRRICTAGVSSATELSCADSCVACAVPLEPPHT